MVTGGKMDGMADEAKMASTAGPRVIQRSRPSVSEVVTTSTGMRASSRFSKSTPSSMMRRSPTLEWTAARFCKKAHGPSRAERGKMSVPLMARQFSAIRSMPSGVGLEAYEAPLMAPTEAP